MVRGVARYGPLGPGLSFGSPYFLIIILAVVGGAALLVLRPGAKKTEAEGPAGPKKERDVAPSRKPPYEICGGVPKRQLCTRCKYYALKSGTLRCGKYGIPIEFAQEGNGRLKQVRKSSKPPGSDDEAVDKEAG